jgi:hypothetical protein
MPKADVNPPIPRVVDGAAENAQTLADKMIRKMDQQSNEKMRHVSADEKAAEGGAA